MRAKLKEVKTELRHRMHWSIPEQGGWLKQVVTGFFNYHAVPTNGRALSGFRHGIMRYWLRTLRRRSQRHDLTWERMIKLAADWLPKPEICHPWPRDRFAVRHPRWEPGAGCDRRSRYELASASLVRPKPSRQGGSESCGRRGNAGSEA